MGRGRPKGAWIAAVIATLIGAGGCGGSSPGPPATATTTRPTTAPARLAFGPAVLRGEISDEAVAESSGLVASRRHPGRLWTHNDSDQPAELYCVEPDGGSCGRWTVAGAGNVDWEDIAAGPGPDPGQHYLYVGDIGDNVRSRDDVVVYRVVEPTITDPAAGGTTAPATAIHLRYEDGPHDAESVAVHPETGTIYVIVKDPTDSGVYRVAAGGDTLIRVGTLGLGLFAMATGADISPDGRRVAVCTPFAGFEYTLDPGADFDTLWQRRPAPVTLPGRTQGEAIAYRLDNDALFVTSEGYPSPLYEIPRL
ncbi:MAG TPA: hypothetical protein VF244_04205 [Acidimicrobiales bacterium]